MFIAQLVAVRLSLRPQAYHLRAPIVSRSHNPDLSFATLLFEPRDESVSYMRMCLPVETLLCSLWSKLVIHKNI